MVIRDATPFDKLLVAHKPVWKKFEYFNFVTD